VRGETPKSRTDTAPERIGERYGVLGADPDTGTWEASKSFGPVACPWSESGCVSYSPSVTVTREWGTSQRDPR